MRVFCVTNTNMLVSKKPRQPNVNPNVGVLRYFARVMPNHAPTQAGGIWFALCTFALGISISCCLSPFCLRCVANANAVSGGIWALLFMSIHSFSQCEF